MTSKVDIANMALAHIRAGSINDFEEASVQAQYVSLFYPIVRDTILRLSNWHFARAERPLVLMESVDLFDYIYTYQIPGDLLRINYLKSLVSRVNRDDDGGAFRPDYYSDHPYIEQYSRKLRVPYGQRTVDGITYIGANEPDLWIDYVSLVDNPNRYDSLFTNMFTWHLAAELAIPVIGGEAGRAERQNCWQVYSQMLASANAQNMNEQDGGMEGGIDESDFIMVRS